MASIIKSLRLCRSTSRRSSRHKSSRQERPATSKEGESIRRRRECLKCEKRFTTYQRFDEIPYMVIKKDGRREKFEQHKVPNGLFGVDSEVPVSCGMPLWLATFMSVIPAGLLLAHREKVVIALGSGCGTKGRRGLGGVGRSTAHVEVVCQVVCANFCTYSIVLLINFFKISCLVW